MRWKGIVAKGFTPTEFEEYLKGVEWNNWRPKFIVLHNTAIPNLKQRPNGFTYQHMLGFQHYYRDTKGWSGGPHLFVDDRKIWVFTPLTVPGVHAPSWNSVSLGVEMLGDYDYEDFHIGRGALVKVNAVAAVAMLSRRLGFDPDTMRFHREDPRTDHHCPGDDVNKAGFIGDVKEVIVARTEITRLAAMVESAKRQKPDPPLSVPESKEKAEAGTSSFFGFVAQLLRRVFG